LLDRCEKRTLSFSFVSAADSASKELFAMRTDGLSLLGLAAKRVTRDPSVIIHPLTYGILQLVLDFVGPGNYLYVSLVNKAWDEAYKSVQSVAIPCVCNCTYEKPESSTCAPSMTATSAVFASPARLLFAVAADFQLDTYWSRPWISVAASTADVPTLSVANEQGMHWSDLVLRALAKSGRLTELMWVHIEQQRSLPGDITNDAAEGGSVDMLAWLYSRGCPLTLHTVVRAAAAGKLQAVKYLHDEGCDCTREACAAAAENGHLAVLQFLRRYGVTWDADDIADTAAGNNDLPLLQWMQQQGAAFTSCTMASAASKGRLAVCQFLHAQGCDWDERACSGAAEANNLELLQWLHDNGCPWYGDEVCGSAARNGFAEMLYYIYGQGAAEELGEYYKTEQLNFAGHYGHMVVAVFLREQGAEWPDQLR
jgi:hypothetical protein